ncbi:ABC transporter permease [Candidatus Bipolaricaulota sp. J31]
MRNVSLYLGAVLCTITVGVTLLGALWTPYDPLRPEVAPAYSPPSLLHPFGTDWFGRDTLSRVLAAMPVGLRVAALGTAMGGVVGTALGAASGLAGGAVGEALGSVINLLLSFPPVLLALLLVTVLGPGEGSVILAIGLFNLPYFGRLSRASFLELKGRTFVEAARACGAGPLRIALAHLLPNAAGPLLVQGTSSLAFALLSEAGLSYLGLGTQPPYPSLGRMLKEAQQYFILAPWTAIFPGLALVVAVLGFNLLGDGLGARLDPRLRRLPPP